MIAEIPTEQAEVIYKYVVPALVWFVGVGIAARVGFHYGLRSQTEAAIRTEKAAFVPLIKTVIKSIGRNHAIMVWRDHRSNIEKSAWRFGTFLNGKRKRVFNAAWKECGDTKEDELLGANGAFVTDREEAKKRDTLLYSRLEKLLEAVESTY